MAGFAPPISGLSNSIVNRVYDPQVRYQPNLHLQPHEEDGAFSTQPHKSTKVWKQQRALYYNENPRERVQEKILAKIVPGKDGREQIVETTKWPYSMFTQITMKFKGQTYGGSGALVGPHHILTCGHNVYDTDENVWAEEITVYPALNDKHAPFGSVKVVKVFTFIQYTNQKDERYDIALLILNKSIGKYTGWAGMLSAPDDQLSQEKVNIVGYPGDKGMTQMWGMKHTIHQIKPEQFEYLIDTNGGQSGSAIWISKFGATMILGVHTTGGKYTNTGVRLSKEKFEALIQKIAESYEREKPQGIVPQPVIQVPFVPKQPLPNTFQPVAPVQVTKAPTLPAWVFGAKRWNKYFGDVGVEPPLPDDIVQRLPELSANNVLVLIPATVNGRPLDLKTLGELVQNPLTGGHKTKYNYFNLGEYVDRPAKSHWALLTRTVIEGSRNKLLKDEQVVLDSYSQKTKIRYEVPTILDATVSNFMEYVRFGTWLYPEGTYTWCQEKYNANYNLLVGGGGAAGVRVSYFSDADGYYGVGGLRKFSERVKPQGIVPQPILQAPFLPKKPLPNTFQAISKQPSPQPTPAPMNLFFQPSLQPALPPIAFGAAKWAQYFGNVGIEPPLPPNIQEILNSSCPLWPEKKVHETHLLTLIPQTLNGKPLTLQRIEEFVQKPLRGSATKYRYFDIGQHTDRPASASHWTLVSRDVIPGSQSKSFYHQQQLVRHYPGYEVPNILNMTIALFIEHVQSGARLYPDKPWTYTRCQENWNEGWQLIVGGFAEVGLYVGDNFDDGERLGVGVQRKFS